MPRPTRRSAVKGSISIDLVILDVGLPDTNGFELCKQIRAESDVPVLFLTARNDEIDKVVGLEIGADDYVAKPFSPREVVARVKAILKRGARTSHSEATTPVSADSSRPPTGQVLHWFSVEAERARVLFFGSELSLTKSEYLILQGMLHHPERVFSRSELMALTSEDAASSLERTADAHIKSLRAKLRSLRSDVDAIRTHRGFGYSVQNPVVEKCASGDSLALGFSSAIFWSWASPPMPR